LFFLRKEGIENWTEKIPNPMYLFIKEGSYE
jgi:hypothetical protein